VPGILGIIQKKHKNRRANENLIKAMLQKLSHNDNYISQAYAGDWFAIGNIGLPIEGESRFTIREEGGYAAAFSGYIYGWKNLDDNLGRDTSDKASRLIDIYQCHKDNFPTKINGSFNIAVVDINAREFLICNDRFGHRQLYYYEDNDLFLFSTEIKAFLAYDKFIKEINFKGVSDYFNYSFLLGDKTFFKGVKILRGGHNIIYKNARITFQKYWDYQFGEESKQTVGERTGRF
jgi:asparagine synthase (glutamine-hydrolysing)